MSHPLKFLITLVLFLTVDLISGNHIRLGDVTQQGEFDSPQGKRQFQAVAHINRPVLCWEDLHAEGITVRTCDHNRIRFSGNIDDSDFVKGTVITFPKQVYLAMGCPMPPQADELSKLDQIVFREIKKAKFKNKDIVVRTNFISGAEVVPDVKLHVGNLAPVSRLTSPVNDTEMSLATLSRTNEIGINNFGRSGSIAIFAGADLDWRLSVSAGVCEFEFNRWALRATWEQRFSADVAATLDLEGQIQKTASGQIMKTLIPGSSFSIYIRFLGKITAGLYAGLSYESSLNAGAAATATFAGEVEAGQKVTVGLSGFNVSPLSRRSNQLGASLAFRGPSAAASMSLNGFIGLRPSVEARISLPVVGDASATAAATIRLDLDARFRSDPFPAVTSGRTLGVCDKCHNVQGGLTLQGRRLSMTRKFPGGRSVETIIRDNFLDYRLGTVCQFSNACRPAGSRIIPVLPLRRCACTCTDIGSAVSQCAASRSTCRISPCSGGASYKCCD